MASKVSKHTTGSWCFSFYNSRKSPPRKWFYFSPDQFTKRQVKEIRDEYNYKYKKGEFDPWKDTVKDTSITVREAVKIYRKTLPKELSESTVNYNNYWLDVIAETFNGSCSRLTSNGLSDFVNSYENYNTRRTVDYVLNRFVDWLQQRGHIETRPDITMIVRTEEKHQTKQTITEDQLHDLLKAFEIIKNEKTANKYTTSKSILPPHRRNVDMTRVLFYMGLRMSDIIHARPAWVLNDFKLLRIGDLKQWGLADEYHPKSQRETDPPIAIPKEVRDIFKKRSDREKFEPLFNINYAKRYQEPFKVAATRAFGKQFAKKFTPHSLRHSCATYWLNERRVPVQEVQRLLRHRDIKTTMGYYHPSTEAHLEAFL